jgi:xylulokinase
MILSIDVGTTSLKLGVFSRDLHLLATSGSPYTLDTPDPSTVQIDPEKWWAAFIESITQLAYPLSGIEIITLSVNSPGFSVMDRQGNPLLPSFTHLDRRAYPQSIRILEAIGDEILLAVTGNIPNPGASSAANILWIRDNYPEIYRRVYMYGHTNTFLAKRLTGNWGVDPSNICMSNVFNTATCDAYVADIAEELEIDLTKLPPVLHSDEKVGELSKAVASLTALPQGTPVLIGANDATCAAVSADIIHNGDIMNVTGTSEMVVVCMDQPLASPHYNLKNHAVRDRWNSMYALNTGGIAIEWAYEQFYRDMSKDDFYGELIPRLMTENRKNIPRFIPFLTGNRYSLRNRTASFSGVTLATTRDDLLLGVISGVASKVKEYLSVMERKIDLKDTVNVTGGGAPVLLACKKRMMKGFKFNLVESGSMLGAAKLANKYLGHS